MRVAWQWMYGLTATALAAGLCHADEAKEPTVMAQLTTPVTVQAAPASAPTTLIQPSLVGPAKPQASSTTLTILSSPVPAKTPPGTAEFVLGPGDSLKVMVWGYPELSSDVIILPNGTISYPLIGTVQASGLTAQELAKALGRALDLHIRSSNVSIVVHDMRSRHFSVIGDVTKAGTYPLWSDQVTVLEALAEAGGMTDIALTGEIRILRPVGPGQTETIPVDVAALLATGGQQAMPTIKPGDVVYVPSMSTRRKVCIVGEVQSPGLYTLTPSMTIIEALSAAGWAKQSGVLKSVMVVRKKPGNQREFYLVNAHKAVVKHDWSQHMALEPGDIVFVPKQFIHKVADMVNMFTSTVEPAAHTYLRVYDASNPANAIIDR